MPDARHAVTALFAVNGAMLSTVLPRLPEVKVALGLSDGQLGLALLGAGLGGLVGSAAARWVLPTVGSRRVAVGGALALTASVPLVAAAPVPAALFAVLVAAGIADAFADVAMNVCGVAVQRRLRRPVLSSMHAAWSIGAVGGGLVGSAAAALAVPLPAHLALVAVVLAALVLGVARSVPDDSGVGTGTATTGRRRVPSPALALLCGMAVLAAVIEEAPASWSAIYLAEHTGAAPGTAGLGFTAFMAAMVVGRLLGDRLAARFGLTAVVRAGGLAAAAAVGTALAAGGTLVGVLAFGVVGLGAAALFPAMFTAAAALPGQGVAAMNVASRFGFLAAPPVVGRIADAVGLPLALAVVVVPAALGIALLAPAAVPRATPPAVRPER